MIDVRKKDGESNESLMRRFSRRVQSTGTLLRVKRRQFLVKKPNQRAVRQTAIRRAGILKEREMLRKLGKLDEYMEQFGRGRKRRFTPNRA